MRLYRSNASSEVRLTFGEEFAAGAEEFTETAGFVSAIESVQVPLTQARDARQAAEAPLPRLRAKRKNRELRVDRVISAQASRIEALEGRKAGPVFEVLYPQGVVAVNAPRGQAQLTACAAYRTRIVECKLSALDEATRASLLAELDTVVARLAEAQQATDTAETRIAELRRVEEARRGDHLRTMDSLFGELRRLFPRDRAMQNTIAPEVDEPPEKKQATTPPVTA